MTGVRKQAKIVKLRQQIDAANEKIADLISKRTALEHDIAQLTGYGHRRPPTGANGEGTMRVLEAMRRLKQAREHDVVQLSGLTPGNVNKILHALAKRGLIARVPGETKYRPWRIVAKS